LLNPSSLTTRLSLINIKNHSLFLNIGVCTLIMKLSLSDIPKECVAYNFQKTARHFAKFYRKTINLSGLQGAQFPLLLAIKLNEPVSISSLAQRLELDRTTLSRNIKRLVEKGYAALERDEDLRVRNIQLTESGADILNQALPLWEKAQNKVIKQFGKENWENMLQSMKELEKIIG